MNEDIWVNPDKFEPERLMNRDSDFSEKDCKLDSIWWWMPRLPRITASILNSPFDFGIATASFRMKHSKDVMGTGVDMAEKFGNIVSVATPLKAIPKNVQAINITLQ